MKKMMFVVLAVLMILPVIVSCGSAPEGNPVAVADFQVVSYADAYAEDGTKSEDLAVSLHSGEVTAYVPEGVAMTVKHVIEGYIYDNGIDASFNETLNRYDSLAGYSADVFFWNYYVNGREATLATEVQATDSIKIVYEK
jgi:hypothetical protein